MKGLERLHQCIGSMLRAGLKVQGMAAMIGLLVGLPVSYPD